MITEELLRFVPLGVTLVAVVAILGVANYAIRRNLTGELSVRKQALMLVLPSAMRSSGAWKVWLRPLKRPATTTI